MDGPKRLSSTCRCGPKGTAVHEMGKCPETTRHHSNILHVETPKVKTPVIRTPSAGTGYIYKPPWEK